MMDFVRRARCPLPAGASPPSSSSSDSSSSSSSSTTPPPERGFDERSSRPRRFASVPLSQCGRPAQRALIHTSFNVSRIVASPFPKSCFQQSRALRRARGRSRSQRGLAPLWRRAPEWLSTHGTRPASASVVHNLAASDKRASALSTASQSARAPPRPPKRRRPHLGWRGPRPAHRVN